MIYSNYHTHTKYSDGSAPPKDYCEQALSLNFKSLGFSDHAPVLFKNSYSLELVDLPDYEQDILLLKKEYEGRLKVYLSLEVDYIPGKTIDFSYFREQVQTDYLIGGVHLVYNKQNDKTWFIDGGLQHIWDEGLKDVFGGDIKNGVRSFYEQSMEMIETQKPDVVAHLDKIKMHNKGRFFQTNDKWYLDLVEATLKLIQKNQQKLEINSRGIYKGRFNDLFPSINIALLAQKMGIPLILSSDAHLPEELNGAFESSIIKLKDGGIKSLVEFNDGKWEEFPLV